jgi:ABC-type nitrate/sulfonate/bicarbonate transport system permease component
MKTSAQVTELSLNTQSGSEPQRLRILWRFVVRFLSPLTIAAILIFWEASVDLGWIDPLFLASPSQIAQRTIEMFATGEIYPHIIVSMEEGLIGFGLALVFGVLLGMVMGRSEVARKVIEPLAMALYSTPSVALLPLFILWFGIGLWSKVLVVFLSTVFSILLATQAGVRGCNPRLIETARAFCASDGVIFFEIILPAALPFIVAGIRISIGRMLIAVFAAEIYAASKGIGYLVMQSGSQFDTPTLFSGVLFLTCTGVALSQLLRLIEIKYFARYKEH